MERYLLLFGFGIKSCFDHKLIDHGPLILRTALIGRHTLKWIGCNPGNLFVRLLPHERLNSVQVFLRDFDHRHESINLLVDGGFGF